FGRAGGGGELGEAPLQGGRDRDPVPGECRQLLLRRAQHVVQVHELRLERLQGAELEETAGEVGRALDRFADRHDLRAARVVGCGVLEQQIAVGAYRRKDVVEVVRHAARDPTQPPTL